MLLLWGDVETCPGPVIKCCSCLKTVRRSQSRAACTRCGEIIHLKCLNKDINEDLCMLCLPTVDREISGTPTAHGYEYEEKLRSMLELVCIENNELLMLGDLNCNYLAKSDHKELKNIVYSSGLKQLIMSPTRIKNSALQKLFLRG